MFGLVLEGGGTKGAYHVGAYKAICELGISVNRIVGVSIGAINGALFAQGDWELAGSVWDDISVNDVVALPQEIPETQNLLDIKNIQAFYKEIKQNKGLDITPLDSLLRNVIDEDKIRNGAVDFGLAAFNVTGIKEQQMFIKDIPKGELVDYLLASACFPIFQPKKIRNSVFIDGGVTNNLPIDMMIKAGSRDIITVEVGGLGILRRVSGAGCNIISVKSGTGSVKTLEFSKKLICEAKQLGYLDTMRAFGKADGEMYYLDTNSRISAKLRYGERLLKGLEYAAGYFDIDRLKIYTVDELIKKVVWEFRHTNEYDSVLEVLKQSEREKTTALARAIMNSDSEMLEKTTVAGLLGNMFEAASAVAYFAERMI